MAVLKSKKKLNSKKSWSNKYFNNNKKKFKNKNIKYYDKNSIAIPNCFEKILPNWTFDTIYPIVGKEIYIFFNRTYFPEYYNRITIITLKNLK